MFLNSLVEESLKIWNMKRAPADNLSAIVVFLDDEFQPYSDDDDDESIASSEADTIIMTNGEDDTPPISNRKRKLENIESTYNLASKVKKA